MLMLMLSAADAVVAGFPARSWAPAVLTRDAVVRSVCRVDLHCLQWHPCCLVLTAAKQWNATVAVAGPHVGMGDSRWLSTCSASRRRKQQGRGLQTVIQGVSTLDNCSVISHEMSPGEEGVLCRTVRRVGCWAGISEAYRYLARR